EIALMMAGRCVVAAKPEYRPLLRERVELMVERMRKSPVLSAESYPDECWTFDNVVALAAIKIADALDGQDHSDLVRDWLALRSEIALMMAGRCVVAAKPEYRPLLRERVELMVERMRKSPVLSAESYPDECWTFDNVVALAAIKIADALDGQDHSDLVRDWLAL